MSKAKKIKVLFCEIFQQGLLFPLYCYVHTTRILLTEVNKCTLPIYINMCLPSITTTTVPTSEQDVEIMKLTHTNFCGRKWTWLNKSIKKVLSFNLLGGGEILKSRRVFCAFFVLCTNANNGRKTADLLKSFVFRGRYESFFRFQDNTFYLQCKKNIRGTYRSDVTLVLWTSRL